MKNKPVTFFSFPTNITFEMNQRDLATLLAPHITDSITWCRMTQVCRRFRETFNSLLIKKTSISIISSAFRTEWVELPASGLKHGLYLVFFENGNLSYENTYKNDIIHGARKSWFDNGQLDYIHNYRDGQRHGLQQDWGKNGEIYPTRMYLDGVFQI